jgi:hypothetical protein
VSKLRAFKETLWILKLLNLPKRRLKNLLPQLKQFQMKWPNLLTWRSNPSLTLTIWQPTFSTLKGISETFATGAKSLITSPSEWEIVT